MAIQRNMPRLVGRLERHFARWAESEGYEQICTQHDLMRTPAVWMAMSALSSWAMMNTGVQMRDSVDSYVHAGGRVARFAGNFYGKPALAMRAALRRVTNMKPSATND